MGQVTPVTNFVAMDEPAYQLVEMTMTPAVLTKAGRKYQPASWAGRQRWRIIWVNRGDALAEYHVLSPHQTVPDVRIPSFWEHTVGELCDIADQWATQRKGAESDMEFLLAEQAGSTLIQDFLDQEEDRVYMVKNHSTFGPDVRVQRDGFPQAIRKRLEREAWQS